MSESVNGMSQFVQFPKELSKINYDNTKKLIHVLGEIPFHKTISKERTTHIVIGALYSGIQSFLHWHACSGLFYYKNFDLVLSYEELLRIVILPILSGYNTVDNGKEMGENATWATNVCLNILNSNWDVETTQSNVPVVPITIRQMFLTDFPDQPVKVEKITFPFMVITLHPKSDSTPKTGG